MSLVSSLNVGVSSLRTYSEGIQTVSNNIANVNTVGYKASHAQYADTFSNILKPLVPNERNTAVKIAPTQVGGGVQIEAISPVFSQGTIQVTNSNSDLAIAGNGFFRVQNGQSKQSFVTRAGNFRVDADGFLVTQQGFNVQGAIGSRTKVVYDTSNGSYDVKGPQDNPLAVIPAGMTQITTGNITTVANSKDITLSNADSLNLAEGMVISSSTGGAVASGATITKIVRGASQTTVTLSRSAFIGATGVSIVTGGLTVSSQSNILTFPPDAKRPTIKVGTPITGPGIPPGTVVQGVSGNVKAELDAAPSPITLSAPIVLAAVPVGVTGLTLAAGETLVSVKDTTITPAQLSSMKGMTVSGTGISPNTQISRFVSSGGNVYIVLNASPATSVDVSGATLSGSVVTSNGHKFVVGDTVSGPGIAPGTTVTAVTTNNFTLSAAPTAGSFTGVVKRAIPNGQTSGFSLALASAVASGSTTVTLNNHGLITGMQVSGTGISAGTTVTVIDANTFTLSAATTASIAAGGKIDIGPGGDLNLQAQKTLDKTLASVRVKDTKGLVVGMTAAGDGIPVDANLGPVEISSISTAAGNDGYYVIGLRYRNSGNPVQLTGDSYSATHFAFGDQKVSLSNLPLVDAYETANFRLGTEFKAADDVGSVKVSFDWGTDFDFYGTDGNLLTGIALEAAKASAPKIRTFNVGTDGGINVILSNGQTFQSGSVLIQSFKDPGALIREGDNLFSGIETAGPYNGEWTKENITNLTPSVKGLGAINGGSLELSNVDIGEEFATMITTQRAFQAGSRIVTTADQMLEEAVNLKR